MWNCSPTVFPTSSSVPDQGLVLLTAAGPCDSGWHVEPVSENDEQLGSCHAVGTEVVKFNITTAW
jgi:hypothetical protein